MTKEEIAEKERKDAETAAASAKAAEEADAKKKADAEAAALQSDPVKAALEKSRKAKRPEIERAAHLLKSTADRLKEIGGDPAEILGISSVSSSSEDFGDEGEDDKPMTVGDFKKMQRRDSQRNSMQLADSIENEDERELAKEYLRTKIRPSGDPEQDLHDAMALVSSVKSRQVAEEIQRKASTTTRRFGSGSGSPAHEKKNFEASEEERAAARIAHVKPENMEKWITDRREGKPVKFGTAAAKAREAEAKRL